MYLLASRSGLLTGRNLANKLGLRFSTNPDRIPYGSKVLVRYGNARESDRIDLDTKINSPSAIMMMSNKHLLWKYLQDDDIIIPKYYPYDGYRFYNEDVQYPLLFRERLRRGGRDIVVCNSKEDLPKEQGYLVPYFETSREYRVHVLFGNVVRVFRKMSPMGVESGTVQVRSTYFGWFYQRADLEQVLCAESLIKTCKAVARKLDCAFCGIDIAWSRLIKRWIVWEANSAPSLNSNTLELYVSEIKDKARLA